MYTHTVIIFFLTELDSLIRWVLASLACCLPRAQPLDPCLLTTSSSMKEQDKKNGEIPCLKHLIGTFFHTKNYYIKVHNLFYR